MWGRRAGASRAGDPGAPLQQCGRAGARKHAAFTLSAQPDTLALASRPATAGHVSDRRVPARAPPPARHQRRLDVADEARRPARRIASSRPGASLSTP